MTKTKVPEAAVELTKDHMNDKLEELGIKGSSKLIAHQLGEGGLNVNQTMSIWQPLPVIFRHSACQVIT